MFSFSMFVWLTSTLGWLNTISIDEYVRFAHPIRKICCRSLLQLDDVELAYFSLRLLRYISEGPSSKAQPIRHFHNSTSMSTARKIDGTKAGQSFLE